MIRPTVRRGLSEAIGVLEDHLDPLGARRPQRLRCERPPKSTSADRDRARVGLDRGACTQRPTVDLPEPDSPTRPSVSPRLIVESDILGRADGAAAAEQAAARDRSSTGLDRKRDRRARPGLRGRRIERSARRRAGAACKGGAAGSVSRRVTPSSTRRPCCSTATRSAISATTPKSCVMNRTAVPCLRRRSSISRRICACVVTSSAVVGSSAMRSFGSSASAIAIMTRWRWPPESSCG